MLNVSVNLEKVLSYNNKTVKFKEDLEAIELVCNTEFNVQWSKEFERHTYSGK